MLKRSAACVLLIALLIMGCSNVNQETPGQPNLVTGITAVCRKGAMELRRSYANPEKVRSVLNYLRLLKTYGPPETDPSAAEGQHIQITLTFSDGSQKIYDQWADQYLRSDGGPWQLISPEQGQELYLLLGMMESD